MRIAPLRLPAVIGIAFTLMLSGASAKFVEQPYPEAVKEFRALLRTSKAFASLDTSEQEDSLRFGAAMFLHHICNEKVAREFESAALGYLTEKLRGYDDAQFVVFGLLTATGARDHACRLARGISGR